MQSNVQIQMDDETFADVTRLAIEFGMDPEKFEEFKERAIIMVGAGITIVGMSMGDWDAEVLGSEIQSIHSGDNIYPFPNGMTERPDGE